jgi:hypothetical protein
MITDEMVEKAALVLFNGKRVRRKMRPVDYIGANDAPECNECRDEARAALTAALPLIRAGVVEECAKECDFMAVETRKLLAKLPRPVQPTLERALVAQAEAALTCAAAIRALKGGEA